MPKALFTRHRLAPGRLVTRAFLLFLALSLLWPAGPFVTNVGAQPGDAPAGIVKPPKGDEAPIGHSLDPQELKRLLASDERVVAVIQLEDAPVSVYQGGVTGFAATAVSASPTSGAGRSKLDLQSAAATRYAAYLADKQAQFKAAITKVAPQAQVRREYSVVFNGVAVQAPGKQLKEIGRLPGVRGISIDRKFHELLDKSVPLIRATEVWNSLGGPTNGGAGMKIAVIDSGLNHKHPFLNDAELTPPAGYPKGDIAFTNNKIIVARAYADPLVQQVTPFDESGHGTHVSGIAAGRLNTPGPDGAMLSGVAPKAFLMNYRVSISHGEIGSFAFPSNIVAAMEDAVKDGADVVNISLGGSALTDPSVDPLDQAVNNAVAAGLVVVAAAGNEGADANTIGSPSSARDAISVGATTAGRSTILSVSAVGTSVPANAKDLPAVPFEGAPAPTKTVGPARYVLTGLDGKPPAGK
ncbi:MAG: S8 family serine peptidase, partial [Chloroflexi bacterium]|nr:S8 family serine peptidase [Chloroflexota bacterium]